MSSCRYRSAFLTFTCFLLLLLTACNPNVPSTSKTGSVTPTTNQSSSTPLPALTPTPIPPVQTDCPTANTARVAIMPPIASGTHPGLVYEYSASPWNTNKNTTILRRYDTVTGEKTDIIQLETYLHEPQISPDGQWVVFTTMQETNNIDTFLLQLVRIDGQELQTLYCQTGRGGWGIGNINWSPDQTHLAFDQPGDHSGLFNLSVLDLTNGMLHDLVSPTTVTSNYPAITNSYVPMKWAGNTSLYVEHMTTDGGNVPHAYGFFLVKNTNLSIDQQNTNLQEIKMPGLKENWGGDCGDIDFSSDNKNIVYSSCDLSTTPSSSTPSTISLQSVQGGALKTIYTDRDHLITNTRFASSSVILFVMEEKNFDNPGVWKINTDGTGLMQLGTTQGFGWPDYPLQIQSYQYIGISRDNSQFAYCFRANEGLSIISGSLSKNDSKSIASTPPAKSGSPDSSTINYNLSLVGWTKM